MPRLRRLRRSLRALWSLPLVISELLLQISELNQRLLEQNQLSRELIQVLSNQPAETPYATLAPVASSDQVIVEIGNHDPSRPFKRPPDPRRLRTDRDVTYTSQPLPRG